MLPALPLSVVGNAVEAQTVRLTKLADVAFGALSSTAVDVTNSQSVCAYASSLTGLYSVRASGSGTGGALTLAGSATAMPYELQWAAAPNRSSGTALAANTTVGGFSGGLVVDQTCSLLNPATASLIVILRSAALSGATAGSYSGSLTLIIAAQ
ncbi:hypothetical protein [Sphingomonas bacterium]|uniref:hypothetical protein n=1 Tax=Sphingomonas bacterium TaxID=1895847 RepID=UPI001576779A|nr:hypothetical protein [Sphingomonas bacterium]